MKRGIAAALALALLAGTVATAELSARVIRVPSSLTLHNRESEIYDGAVESNEEACERGRTVRVFHDKNRNGVDGRDYRIGKDRTDRHGEYEVEGSQAPMGDRIIAVVGQRTLADGTVCLAKERKSIALSG
jgi:hypothetical protein